MKTQEKRIHIMKGLRKPSSPHIENPWATEAAAETLEQNGQRRAAQLVRAEIGPSAVSAAMDPMELLIVLEENAGRD